MKKIIYLLVFLLILFPISVKADHIYNIDMDIYLDEDGNANITEVWNVQANQPNTFERKINQEPCPDQNKDVDA